MMFAQMNTLKNQLMRWAYGDNTFSASLLINNRMFATQGIEST